MATKKSTIVKATDGNDLAKAGIDVKLSKMEIADYIADKAKEELESRLSKVTAEIAKWQQGYHTVLPTPDQKAAADALTQATGKKFYCTLSYHWSHDTPNKWVVCIGMDVKNYAGQTCFQNAVAMEANDDQLPGIDMAALNEEQKDIQERLWNLKTKKHRTILLEKILSSNESGKKVLADLQGMVARAVSG